HSFDTFKLICNDFLSFIQKAEDIRAVIEIAGIFCKLKDDDPLMLNTALTSIAILWDAADLIRRQSTDTDFELIAVLLAILQNLGGSDHRFELRNSAAPTMFRILQLLVSDLDARQWLAIRNMISDLVSSAFRERQAELEREQQSLTAATMAASQASSPNASS